VKEEIHILRATLLECLRGPQHDRHDASDKESLCELARIHGYPRKSKDSLEARQDL